MDLAFLQIAADRFAQCLFARREIEQIVDQLECHPQVPCALAQLLFSSRIRTQRTPRPAWRRPRKDRAVLRSATSMQSASVDVDTPDAFELNQLTFDHHLGQADEQIENVEVAPRAARPSKACM